LHGSGMDHRAWALQSRWFAFHGYNVVAPDFPAHSLSEGTALTSIEESSGWLLELLDELKLEKVHVVGHSQGYLSGLELAANNPERVLSLTGIGTAAAIPVNPALIETAKASAFQAADMMLQWGFGPKIHLGTSPTPGMQPLGQGRQIMGNNPLAEDLQCCADYEGGQAALSKVECRTAMILAGKDKMTPMKAGLAVAETLKAELTVLPDYGHMLPVEAPTEVLAALRAFIGSQ
ncbi:MAG: alpha/beta hydrolase, partial [Pseudomonadota bacterium]